jgi:ABC-type amino acid transport substrate-binding protein
VSADGAADGFSVELLRKSLQAMGRDVVFRTGPWPRIKEDLAEGRLQALPLVGRTPERETVFDFTVPYLTMHGALVVREDNSDIHGPSDLRGRRVAVLEGDNAEEYLRRARLGAVVVPAPSFAAALQDLSAGRCDAVVIQKLLALQLMRSARIQNLKVVGPPLRDFTQHFCFAVRKGDRDLLATLNEGLAIVTADGTLRRLYARWFHELEAMGQARRRIIVGGDRDYPPYEFLDPNGQPAGFNVDLTRAIARHAGLEVDIRLGAWEGVRGSLGSGEIDVVEGMFYSPERARTYAFSPPTTMVQHVLVVRKGERMPPDLDSARGMALLVMEGDILHDLAVKKGYRNHLLLAVSQEEALRRLAAGEGEGALVAKVPALYWIKTSGWRNLKVSDRPILTAEYCYATLPGEGGLLSQFSEGLAALKTTGEYRDLQKKWLGPYEPSGWSPRTILTYSAAILLPLLALLAGSFLWSAALRRQVASRTEQLRAEIQEHKRAEEALAQSRRLAAVGQLASGLAHEVRNPLFALQANAAAVARAAGGRGELAQHVEHIHDQVRRLDALIKSLLELGRPLDPDDFVECSARDLIQSALAELDPRLPQVSNRVRSRIPEGLLVNAVPGKLVEAFVHLLENALQHTPGDEPVDVEAEADGGCLCLRVRDRGEGLPKEADPDRIFEPFWTSRQGHRGLGLALARHYVTAHGGTLTAENNEPPPGAVFTVRIPL